MSTLPIDRERRLQEIREEAESKGLVTGKGAAPAGAPIPRASEQTGYYGLPLLKEPQWKWEVPLYLFMGGAAGSAAVIAAMADWVGKDHELARHARWLAAGGAIISSGLLIADLGRPERFLNMLRVFKPQSPMSVGSWLLASFGTASGAAAFAKELQARWNWLPVRVIADMSQVGAALVGLPFHNYTGVLVGATVVPLWNQSVGTLPMHFGASGVQAACSMLELAGHENRALNHLAIAANAFETYEGVHLETRHERALRPLKRGTSGWIIRAGGVLSGPLPLALRLMAVFGNKKVGRTIRRAAAISGIAGSLLTRYGWVKAGRVSARDWRLPLEIEDNVVVAPQPFPENVPEKLRAEKLA
jgi:formate-dependent nitrite reductase membrane component NrfD